VLGKLDPEVKLPLDAAIRDLKKYSYDYEKETSPKIKEKIVDIILFIIEGMDIPEKMTNE
ncbi:uncharacterized protein METZ01_LOCUS407176, partial [marine metagenome]